MELGAWGQGLRRCARARIWQTGRGGVLGPRGPIPMCRTPFDRSLEAPPPPPYCVLRGGSVAARCGRAARRVLSSPRAVPRAQDAADVVAHHTAPLGGYRARARVGRMRGRIRPTLTGPICGLAGCVFVDASSMPPRSSDGAHAHARASPGYPAREAGKARVFIGSRTRTYGTLPLAVDPRSCSCSPQAR